MPESKNRKKDVFTPPPDKTTTAKGRIGSGRWVAPVMVACFVLGLIWIVTFYIAGKQIPVMSDLNNWNILIGMGLIAVGFVVSTQWK